MVAPRSAFVTYAVATEEGNRPAVRLRLAAGQRISDAEWPEFERAVRRAQGVVQVIHSPSDLYTYILIQLAVTAQRYTDAGLIADGRAICRAANITITRGPEPAPER